MVMWTLQVTPSHRGSKAQIPRGPRDGDSGVSAVTALILKICDGGDALKPQPRMVTVGTILPVQDGELI